MLLDMKRETDEDTWQPLSLAAGRLAQRLEEQLPENERETKTEKTVEQQREYERFVETRLREIRRFERRYLNNRP